jgi:hypothetical protein
MGYTQMQKIITFITLCILFTSSLMASEFTSIGIKLGYNSSTFAGNDIPGKGVSSQGGVAIGGFVCYTFNQRFSLRQEVLFTIKGAKINTIGDVYLTNLFMYFELPLLAKMTFLSGHRVQPNIFIGPAFDLTIMATNDVAVLEDIRSYDLGIVFGAGIDVWKISIDVRFNIGLLNFDQSDDDIDLKNRTFSFMVGFAF